MLRGGTQSQPPRLVPPTHDAHTRLLTRLEPEPDILLAEVEPLVSRHGGVLALDDSTLDHLHAKKFEPVHRHWSGKHKRVVWGINLISLVWSDGDRTLPLDYRLHADAPDGQATRFFPRAVHFDRWNSEMGNLKLVRDFGRVFLTRLKANRKVDLDRREYRPINTVSFDGPSAIVQLEGFGSVRVFRMVSRDGDTEYWATLTGSPENVNRVPT